MVEDVLEGGVEVGLHHNRTSVLQSHPHGRHLSVSPRLQDEVLAGLPLLGELGLLGGLGEGDALS